MPPLPAAVASSLFGDPVTVAEVGKRYFYC
jgi:hypothetical protein